MSSRPSARFATIRSLRLDAAISDQASRKTRRSLVYPTLKSISLIVFAWLFPSVMLAAPSVVEHNACDTPAFGDQADKIPDKISACTRILEDTSKPPHDRALILSVRATAYSQIGDDEKANADFAGAIRTDPGNADIYLL